MAGMVLIEKRAAGICLLTLNRPHAANALSAEMLEEIHQALKDLKSDRGVRVAIVTGAGEKVFCAGADLKERQGMKVEQVLPAVRKIGTVIHAVEELPQPVIAALNGGAFGGGLELALACDIRIGALEANYGLTETSLAIIPGAGGTQRLPRLIGIGKAKEMIFTARRLSGEEAAAAGLFEYAVPREQVIEKALEIAGAIARNGPLALMQAKNAINKGIEADLAIALKIEELAYSALIPTEDRVEGLQAFAEKRTPQYKGR
ncbi:enoyl-CoA hydratase [Heyndrickxia acidiproducens]|uniref:enoyl-CoA hydratase n=1 Tax=Heyndrickxia acidiproducens TaxID=1121084 RepID=UPI000381AD10|nr:enoyl-CoA hydratase [Heyndrickxia acidiproducens]